MIIHKTQLAQKNPTQAPTAAPTQAPTDIPTEAPTTQPPGCGDNDDTDDNLNLDDLCAGFPENHLVANPNSQKRYVECNGGPNNDENSVKKFSPVLLFDKNRLTCDYHGLVKGY